MQPVNILFQRLHADAVLPTKGHPDDACFDVVAVGMEVKNGYVAYKLGFATAIPDGWQALVFPRSSISGGTDLALCNGVAVIDAGYRGEWEVRFYAANRTFECRSIIDYQIEIHAAYAARPLLYKVGDKVAQVQFQRVPQATFEEVDTLPDSSRGAGGFGSTGA